MQKEDSRKILLHCVALLVRPLARFCIRRAVKFQEFNALAKQAFVKAAREELESQHKEASVSRLSVVTGLQRKDLALLLQTAPEERAPDNLITRLIGQWSSAKPYLDEGGHPRSLSTEGIKSEFAALVRQVSSDLNHHTMLFELERLGAVVRNGSRVTLTTPAFIPRTDLKESAQIVGADVADLIDAFDANVFGDEETAHLQARTAFDNIPQKHLPEIRKWCLVAGRRIHDEARLFLSKFDRDITKSSDKSEGRVRVTFSTFSFSERIASESRQQSTTKKGVSKE